MGFIIYNEDMLEAQVLDLVADNHPIEALARALTAIEDGFRVVLVMDMPKAYRQLLKAKSLQEYLLQVEEEANYGLSKRYRVLTDR